MSNNNIVYVGSTLILNYCLAIAESLRHRDLVALNARGKSIRRAVDIAEVTKNRCLKGVNVKSIYHTEEFDSHDGYTRNLSAITILLKNE